jgi:radical SAM protein with 4Fe4S-binding SPASM domain
MMGHDAFFLDPFGDVLPCNGMAEKAVMGNLREQSFSEIWNSQQADTVRRQVKGCERRCWMIGSASPAIRRHLLRCGGWAMWKKVKG